MRRRNSRRLVLLLLLIVSLGASPGAAIAQDSEPKGGWLGVRLNGTDGAQGGVMVSRIFEGSPADEAGLRARDTILTFGGTPVDGIRELIRAIQELGPGAWVPITIARQGKEVELDVRLSDRPAEITRDGMRKGWIGVESIDLPAALREHFGAPDEAGVMISEVAEYSPAEAAGFRLGDVLYEIDGIPVVSRRTLRELVEGGGVGNLYEYSVSRDGARMVLEARIETSPQRDDETTQP